MQLESKQNVFLCLLRAGLWHCEVGNLSDNKAFSFDEIYQIAQEQSVVGLIASGLEHVSEVKVPQDIALTFVCNALQLEQRNEEMNSFIAKLVNKLREADVYTLLLKGQGVAQCYERPLWRSSGDIDFLMSDTNYKKAKKILIPIASSLEEENGYSKHLGMVINQWEVEMHGSLRVGLWKKLERVLDNVENTLFFEGKVRSWMNDSTQVFLPDVNEDVFYVFAHILQHFFKEGIGLRQICDWCRLLWAYKNSIDLELLRFRLFASGTESEWKAFAALAVDYLGMPVDAMPFYSPKNKWHKKANQILCFIFEMGNFGHNRDMSFLKSNTIVERKAKRFCHITKDFIKQLTIFPLDSVKVWTKTMGTGFRVLIKGK